MQREQRTQIIEWIIPALYAVGFYLIANASAFPDPLYGALPGMLLFVLPLAYWSLAYQGHPAADWVFVPGCFLIILFLSVWGNVATALSLLSVPVGLALLLHGTWGGLVAAMFATSVLVYTPYGLFSGDRVLYVSATFAVWCALGLMWMGTHPLLDALKSARVSLIDMQSKLERTRDDQAALKQALHDLAEANMQLSRFKQLAEASRKLADDARVAKEQFVANVSHELRTPLNMILGFGEMIVETPETYGPDIPPALLSDLAVVVRNSKHLSALIDDVLDLSQIDATRMALIKERVALKDIVDSATIAVRPLFESKGLELDMELPTDLPLVYCDRTRIRQVMLNLLSNAGRFTERGGVRVRARTQGNQLVVSVTDTGPGIAAEDMGKLFQPFHQLDGSIRRRHEGSGLGLSISKGFLELHGGKLWVESTQGAGTTFFFSLPVDEPANVSGGASRWFNPYAPQYESTPHPPMLRPVTRPRFVVLEKGNALQRLLVRHMDNVEIVPTSEFGQTIQECRRLPAQALLINTDSISELLSDLNGSIALPDDAPTLICSIPGSLEAADALGVADYLIKPVSRDDLLSALAQLRLEGNTLLIVDDEPEMLRWYRRVLAAAGRDFQVLRAMDGEQGLAILRQRKPGAILLDLVMPNMDGFQFLAIKNQDPVLRDIPVIAVTARDPIGHPIVSNALVLTKKGGLSVSQLLACVENACGILSVTGQSLRTGVAKTDDLLPEGLPWNAAANQSDVGDQAQPKTPLG